MLKKFLIIMMLLALAVSLVPSEAFCHDHEAEEEPLVNHHCSLACHFNVVMPSQISLQEMSLVVTLEIIPESSYQDPAKAPSLRPPITLS